MSEDAKKELKIGLARLGEPTQLKNALEDAMEAKPITFALAYIDPIEKTVRFFYSDYGGSTNATLIGLLEQLKYGILMTKDVE